MVFLALALPVLWLAWLGLWIRSLAAVLRHDQDALWLWALLLCPPIGTLLHIANFDIIGDKTGGLGTLQLHGRRRVRLRELQERAPEELRLSEREELARLLFDRGDWTGALRELRPVMDLDEENPSLHLLAGQALLRLGMAEAALQHLRFAYASAMDSSRDGAAQACFEALLELGRGAEAESFAEEALATALFPGLLLRRAQEDLRAGNRTRAWEALERLDDRAAPGVCRAARAALRRALGKKP